MATTTNKDDVLSFDVLVDIRASLKAMEKFSRSMKKSMKLIAESGERMGKATGKTAKEGKKDTDKWADSLENLNEKYEYHNELLKKRGDALREMRKQGASSADVEVLEKEYKQMVGVMKAARTLKEKGGLLTRPLAPKGLKKAMLTAGEELKNPLQNFLKKDAHGLVEDAGRMFAKTFSRSFHGARLLYRVGGAQLQKKGARKVAAGEFGGAAIKKTGELLSGLGKMMRPLAALGPMLTGVGAATAALIKLFLDADAMVKEFNRGIMDSASNLEFLENSGGNAADAIVNMRDSLEGVRAAAMDYKFNNALGITKETHAAILNTLTQEGVAFGNLAKKAGNSVKGMEQLTKSIVASGVGFARGLGVPLQEVMAFQAEMMVEMGQGAEQARDSFAKVTRAAAASGIAGTKFFAMIRSASADLTLWNLRLEGAVDLLGKLGKIMNPRAAQQFFQSVSSGFKTMGRQDLLKTTIMAGVDDVRKIMQDDVAANQQELAKSIIDAGGAAGRSQEEVVQEIQKGYAAADRLIREVKDREKIGTLRTKAAEIDRKSQSAKSEDTYELSQGLGELTSVGSQITVWMKAAESLGGSLLNPNQMALSQTAEGMGYGPEQIRAMHSLALAAKTQKDVLLEEAKTDPKYADPKKQAARIAEIMAMRWDAIIATDKSLQAQSDQFKESQGGPEKTVQQAIEEMSTKQGDLTQSLTNKLENFFDWFMNQFYSLMMDIWDAVLTITKPFAAEQKEARRLLLQNKNKSDIQAFDRAGGNMDVFRENMLRGGSDFSRRLMETLGRGRRPGANTSDTHASESVQAEISRALGKDSGKIMRVASRVIKDAGRLAKVGEMALQGGSLEEALNYAGVKGQERDDVMGQASWELSPLQIAALAGIVDVFKETLGSGTPGAPVAPAITSPSAPTQVTAEATETTSEAMGEVVDQTQRTADVLQHPGVRIAPETLKEDAKSTETAMLSALRIALFEFYMYSGTDRGAMIASMKAGGVTDPRQVAQRFYGGSVEGGSPVGGLNAVRQPLELPARALGGYVTGVANGLAVVAAQGEGLASVGRGERIVPAGGGGSGPNVNVSVNGVGGSDLARLIEGKVVEGIREYKRREKFY